MEILVLVAGGLIALVVLFYLGIGALVVMPITVGVAFVGWLIGGSAGAVNVAVNLTNINLHITGAMLGVSSSAPPAGDVAVNSQTTLAVIADPNTGIASTATTAARTAILTALDTLQYAPSTKNDPLTTFASQAGSSFAAVPLLVA